MSGLTAGIVIVSDRATSGERPDQTAPLLAAALSAHGFTAELPPAVVPDERDKIAAAIRALAARVSIVLTSGGTGIGARDVTPEATRGVIDREIPGLGEAMRAASRSKTVLADLSRATAGTAGRALVVNLPGSPKGAVECLEAVVKTFAHAAKLLSSAPADCAADAAAARRAPDRRA